MNPERGNPYHEDNLPHLAGLGLPSEPFADTATGHFYYEDADSAQRLDLMLHLAPYSPLLVIAGKPGVGKTALLQQFVARANQTWRMAVVTARVDMGGDELLRDMARGFGLPVENRADQQDLYTALIAQLRALRQNALVPILLLDDAQYLSAAMMELILKLCKANDAGHILSVILFGTPQLQNLLDSPALTSLAARVTHTFEVTPFTEEETARYIRHRLRASGIVDDGPFDSMLINRIHASSGGIPDRINELAQQVLADKSLGGKERKAGRNGSDGTGSNKRRMLMMAAAAAFVAVLMVAGPLRSFMFESAPPAPDVPQQTQAVELPPPLAVGEEERIIRPAEPEVAPAAEVPTARPKAAASPMEEVQPLPLPPASPAIVAPAANTEPVHPAAAPAPLPVARPANEGILGEEWVRAQPGDHYTLQLMALREEKTARQFIEMHHLQDKAAYFPIRRDGQILYSVVYGVYPSPSEAARAAKELPAKWGAPNPWVRRFKNLHSEPGK